MIITPLSHVSKGRASQFFSGCCAAESLELKAAEATAQEFTGSVPKDWCWISIYAGAVGFVAYIIQFKKVQVPYSAVFIPLLRPFKQHSRRPR